MGTDLFKYLVEKIEGKTVTIDYKSGQSQGLAPAGNGLDAAAHWVSALAEHEKAFQYASDYKRVASCPLTQHERWKKATGDVVISGLPDIAMDDIKHFIANYKGKTRSYGTSWGEGSIAFDTVADAQKFTEEWNGKEYKGETVGVVFKNVEHGPEWIDQYSRPQEDFEGFVENVEIVKVDYENRDEDQGYYTSSATYKITMTDESYLSHLQVNDTWDGR